MIDWLAEAFGLPVHAKYMDSDTVAHAELVLLGSSMIMLGERATRIRRHGRGAGPGWRQERLCRSGRHGRRVAWAKAAGGEILEEPTDRDYGSRDFVCADPEGNVWSFGTYWPKADKKA